MSADVRTLVALAERGAEARPVLEDAVRELTHDEIDHVANVLGDLMRGNNAEEAGRALLAAHRIMRALGPSPMSTRELATAAGLRDRQIKFITKPWTAYVPVSRYPPTSQAVQTMYDSNRSTMRIAADRLERHAVGLRWLDELVRAGRWQPPEPLTGRHLVTRDGKVLASGQDLAVVTRYARAAGGLTLVAKEIVLRPGRAGRDPAFAPGVLHVLFSDGATVSIPFGSFSAIENWLANKQRVRTSWLAGAPSVVVEGPTR